MPLEQKQTFEMEYFVASLKISYTFRKKKYRGILIYKINWRGKKTTRKTKHD